MKINKGSLRGVSWEHIVVALENWASVVERCRRVPVERRWTSEPVDERETLAEVDPNGELDLAAYLVGAAMPEFSEANRWVNMVGRGVEVYAKVGGQWTTANVIARDLKTGMIQVQWPPQDYIVGPGRTVPLNAVPRLWRNRASSKRSSRSSGLVRVQAARDTGLASNSYTLRKFGAGAWELLFAQSSDRDRSVSRAARHLQPDPPDPRTWVHRGTPRRLSSATRPPLSQRTRPRRDSRLDSVEHQVEAVSETRCGHAGLHQLGQPGQHWDSPKGELREPADFGPRPWDIHSRWSAVPAVLRSDRVGPDCAGGRLGHFQPRPPTEEGSTGRGQAASGPLDRGGVPSLHFGWGAVLHSRRVG